MSTSLKSSQADGLRSDRRIGKIVPDHGNLWRPPVEPDTVNTVWDFIVRYIWVPAYGLIGLLFRLYHNLVVKMVRNEENTESEFRRIELSDRNRESQRQEIIDSIQSHHESVMTALGAVRSEVNSNGKRIGAVEGILMDGGRRSNTGD